MRLRALPALIRVPPDEVNFLRILTGADSGGGGGGAPGAPPPPKIGKKYDFFLA